MKFLMYREMKFSVILLLLLAPTSLFSQSWQTYLWGKGIGTTGVDEGTQIVVDASGNVYTTGFFIGTADFDPGAGTFNMTSNTTTWYDVFVTKFDASGNFVWAKRIGGSLNDLPTGLVLDNANNLIISGYFNGTVDFDPNAGTTNLTAAGNEDCFIWKLSDQGNLVWAKRLGGAQNDRTYDVAVDASDNVYATGVMNVSGDFDPGAGTVTLTAVGGQDCYVIKLNAIGDLTWVKQIGGTGNEVGIDVEVDQSNNTIVSGYFTATPDFDPGAGTATITSAGSNDIFIEKLDASGNFVFVKSIGGTSDDQPTSTKIDGNNNIVAVGFFAGTIDADPGAGVTTFTSTGSNDGVLVQLNNSGNLNWAYQLGSSAGESYTDVDIDAANDIYAVGILSGGTIDFDPGAGTFNMGSSGFEDGFIQKLTSSAGFVAAWRIGGGFNNDRIYGVNASTSEIHTTGFFNATADMDPSAGTANLTSVGSSDIFVQKMGCAVPATPTSTTAPSALGICPNQSVTLTATGQGTLGWYTAASGGTYLGGGTSYNTGNLTATTTYYVQDSTCIQGSRTAVTVTVNEGVANQTITATLPTVCSGGSTTITTSGSETGINYYLRNDADNSVVQGPVAGTGGPLAFSTGALSATTTYNVLGSNPFITNYGLDLDGTNDYVTMGTSNRGIVGTITVSARVKTTVNGASQFIVDKYLSGGIGFYLFINATGQASFQGRDVAGGIKSSGLSTTMVANNQWHEITGVVRSTGWEIWVDGVLESSGAYSLGATGLGTTAPLLVGQFGGTYTPLDIDRLAIWNTALAPATILANATGCLTGGEANIVAYYPFNEGTGTTVTDYSPSAINGTLTNMTVPACWILSPISSCGGTCDSEMGNLTTVTVTSTPPQPTISAGGPTTFCAGGSVTLTSSAGSSYLWSNGATTQSINVTTAGTYTVQVGSGSCQSVPSAGTTVTVNPLPSTPTISAGGPTTFCAGGSVTLTSSAGNSYLWSNGATTASINATTAGTYTVQVTNAAGCQSAASLGTTVTVNAAPSTPTISAGGSTTFCAGGSVTLTSSTGTTYLWSNGATTASINATTAGTYTVQVTNAAGCQSTASAGTTVTVNALPSAPTISSGGSTTFCTGGSVTLTSSIGTSYLWSNGATTVSINATTAGTYTVQVTNAAGCQSTASAGTTVTVNALPSTPTISAGGSTTFCSGGSVTLTSSAGTSYLWSTGATTSSINATTAGTYTVQVTNAAGCQSTASAGTTVTVNALPSTPTISAGGPTTFCAGGSVTLTSSTGTSYLWSNGATTSYLNITTPGTYSVQVTNAQGCQSIASAPVTVTVNPLPNAPIISPNGPTTFCSGGTVNLASSAGITYLWSTGATTASIDVTTSGSFSVQITGPNGCQSPASVVTVVTVNLTPVIALGTLNNPTSCTINDGSIQITGSGTGNLSWTGTASGSSNGATLPTTLSSLSDGSYNITFTSTDGCPSNVLNASLSAPSAPPAPIVSAGGATTFCAGGSVTLTSSAGTSYLWSNGETTASIVVSNAGNYTVSITDGSGCSSPASAATAVAVNALPVIASGTVIDPVSCVTNDGSIEVTGTGTGDLSWSGASNGNLSGTTLPVTIPNLGQGNYTIAFTDANGCTSTDLSVTLVAPGAPSAPTVTPNGPTAFCEGGSVTLTASSATSYLWSNGETTQSITIDADGTFSVVITDANGCISPSSATTAVSVDQMPDLTVSEVNNVITANQTGATYQWVDCNNGNQPIAGETGISFTPAANGSYAVIVTSGTCSGMSACTTISTIGIEEQLLLNLGVQPNPGHELVRVTASSTILEVNVLSMRGELIRTEYQEEFNVQGLARGIYLLRVTTTDGIGTVRLAVE